MRTRFPSLVLTIFLLEEWKGRGRDSFILRSANLASECTLWQFLQMGQQMRFSSLLWKMIWWYCCPPSSMMTEGVSSSVEKWGYWMVVVLICTCWKSYGWASLFFLNLQNLLDFCFCCCWQWYPALFLIVLVGLSGYSWSRFCFLLGLLDLIVSPSTSITSSSVFSALEQLLSSTTSTPSEGGLLNSLLKGYHLSLAQLWSSSSKLQQACLLSSRSWLRKHWEVMVNPCTAILYSPSNKYLSIWSRVTSYSTDPIKAYFRPMVLQKQAVVLICGPRAQSISFWPGAMFSLLRKTGMPMMKSLQCSSLPLKCPWQMSLQSLGETTFHSKPAKRSTKALRSMEGERSTLLQLQPSGCTCMSHHS